MLVEKDGRNREKAFMEIKFLQKMIMGISHLKT